VGGKVVVVAAGQMVWVETPVETQHVLAWAAKAEEELLLAEAAHFE
jgi:hypothetical protein